MSKFVKAGVYSTHYPKCNRRCGNGGHYMKGPSLFARVARAIKPRPNLTSEALRAVNEASMRADRLMKGRE